MCTKKLTRSQLRLAHNAKVKTDMPKKNEKHLKSVESVSPVGGKGEELRRKRFYFYFSFIAVVRAALRTK